MSTPFEADRQWALVAAELLAGREAQEQAWGSIDNATLGRYLAGEVSANERQVVEAALERHPKLRELTDLVRDVLSDYEPALVAAPAAPIQTPLPAPATLSFRNAQQKKQKRFGSGWAMARQRLALVAAACLLLALGLFLQQGLLPSNPIAIRHMALGAVNIPANTVAVARKHRHTVEELEQTFKDLEHLMNAADATLADGSEIKKDLGVGLVRGNDKASDRELAGMATTTTQDLILPGVAGKQGTKGGKVDVHKPTAPPPAPSNIQPGAAGGEAGGNAVPKRRNALADFLVVRDLVAGNDNGFSGQAVLRTQGSLALGVQDKEKKLATDAVPEKEETERYRKARALARQAEPYLHFEQLYERQAADEKGKVPQTGFAASSADAPTIHVVNTFGKEQAEGAIRGSADLACANAIHGQALFGGGGSERNLQKVQANNRIEQRKPAFENAPFAQDGRRLRAALPGEVWSGKALNNLCSALVARFSLLHAKNVNAALAGNPDRHWETALDGQLLGRIHFCSLKGEDGRLLGYERNLRWPALLKTESFDQPRRRVEHLFAHTVQQARCKQCVDAEKTKDLKAQLQQMTETLKNAVAEITPIQYIESRRFLNFLEEGVKLLEDPNVGRHVVHLRVTAARTVRELVQHMNTQALQFAAAPPGDEEAYLQLYQMLERCQPEPVIPNTTGD